MGQSAILMPGIECRWLQSQRHNGELQSHSREARVLITKAYRLSGRRTKPSFRAASRRL